jgi:hypothetical protein
VVKNEPPQVLREWAAFHLRQGFRTIAIYDDGSEDPVQLRTALAPLHGVQLIQPFPSTETIADACAAGKDGTRHDVCKLCLDVSHGVTAVGRIGLASVRMPPTPTALQHTARRTISSQTSTPTSSFTHVPQPLAQGGASTHGYGRNGPL